MPEQQWDEEIEPEHREYKRDRAEKTNIERRRSCDEAHRTELCYRQQCAQHEAAEDRKKCQHQRQLHAGPQCREVVQDRSPVERSDAEPCHHRAPPAEIMPPTLACRDSSPALRKHTKEIAAYSAVAAV